MRGIDIVIALLLFSCGLAEAQSEIYISNANRDIAIVSIANNNCSLNSVVTTDRTLSDITLHPTGRMYGCNFSDKTIYEVDLATGQTNDILTISEANRLVGMTADANGLLYVTEGEVLPSDLYVVDPVAGTYINKGPLADGSAGDLSWSFGKLYNASDNNKLVEVNIEDPASSVVIGDFNGIVRSGDRIFALVSVFTSCIETQTFALSEMGDYYTLDLATADVTRLCIGSVNIYGATSEDEFLASECFISLDLDSDNSSGASGSDFNSIFGCASDFAPIADDDVIVLASTQVDSIIISLGSGVQDGANEFLEPRTGSNFTVSSAGPIVTATSNGASTADAEDFLAGMLYRNTVASPTPGIRDITVIVFSESESDTAEAHIEIGNASLDVDLGEDQVVCPDTDVFLDADIGSPTAEYLWSTGATTPSITVIEGDDYSVTVTDGNCTGTDNINIEIFGLLGVDLGPDTVLCNGGSLVLDVDLNIPDADYVWSTGATGGTITVSSSGTYAVQVAEWICIYSDTIDVEIYNADVDLGGDFTICPGDDFTLSAEIGEPGAVYSWNTGAMTPVISENSGGQYSVAVSLSECTYSDEITVTEVTGGTIAFSLGPDMTICLGESATFSSGFSPSVYNHTWSTGSNNSSITTSSPGIYILELSNQCQSGIDSVELTVEDCDTMVVEPPDTTTGPVDTIDIVIEEPCTIILPAAFSPNGDGHNDLFGPLNECPDIGEIEFRIYNRYGEEVFSGGAFSKWDGRFKDKYVPMDIFTWYLEARHENGDIITWHGSVLVLR